MSGVSGDDAAAAAAAQHARKSSGSTSAPTILSHLLTLPSQTLLRLYSYPSNALAVFRLLPPIARHIVLVLLFLPDPPRLPSKDIAALFGRGKAEDMDGARQARAKSSAVKLEDDGDDDDGAAVAAADDVEAAEAGAANAKKRSSRHLRNLEGSKDVLSRLGIIKETGGSVYLNGIWSGAMRRALIGGGDHQSFGVPSSRLGAEQLSASQLDDFALQSWESILLYMVASTDARTPSRPVQHLLRSAGLMHQDPQFHGSTGRNDVSHMIITAKGFQFLLEDVSTQLWTLLHSYLVTLAESSGSRSNTTTDIVEHLTFLFTLSSATLGQDYEASSLTETQRDMLPFFADLGLIYRKNGSKSATFYPTRLVTTLTSSGQLPLMGTASEDGEEDKGFVILETNYKIYAYTNNKLRINILGLFVHIRSRYPNLVTGMITRDSVKEALRNGIGAEQIIMYLTHHAHPQMYKNSPLLPVTVTDQIRLWEREKNRVQDDEGILYSDFSSGADFELVREYAEQMGVLLWSDAQTRRLFVAASGTAPLSDFIKRRILRDR